MKHFNFLTIIVLILLALPQFGSDVQDQKAKLIVKFYGFESDEGSLRVALFNSEENYKVTKSPFIGKSASIKNKTVTIEFEDLSFGEYAIKTFHDEDNDKELNTNFLGIPSEDYGFSNNARGSFGPPDWKEAKFKVQQSSVTIEIEVK